MYAGHRKAEMRRHHSLWDLRVVLTWSQGCFPASPFTPIIHTDPSLYRLATALEQKTWLQSISSVIPLVQEQRRSCEDLWVDICFKPSVASVFAILLMQTHGIENVRLTCSSPSYNCFIPLLRETHHFQYEARREPGPSSTLSLRLSWLWVCEFLRLCARGLVQQGANTHVLLCEPSATCCPVWCSLCHPHIICGQKRFWLLQALLHLTSTLISCVIGMMTCFLRSQRQYWLHMCYRSFSICQILTHGI